MNYWKPAPGFHWTSLHEPFPFADFALYSFYCNPHGSGDNYTLSTVSSPSKSSKLGEVLGIFEMQNSLPKHKELKNGKGHLVHVEKEQELQLILEHGLNCIDLLICGIFSVNTYTVCNRSQESAGAEGQL